MADVLLAELKETHQAAFQLIGIRGRVAMADFQTTMGRHIQSLSKYAKPPLVSGPARYMSVYFKWSSDEVDFMVGLASAASAPDGLKAYTLARGRYIRAVYSGPYERMPQAYTEAHAYLHAHKLRVIAPVYEEYVSHKPKTTHIYFPVAEAV